ncbi:4'-phosphopantetheinyl transferase family protein [Erwinia sp. V71]|uniref:4'-phosphopantetheinyl transferase family protein n=1 Tax=Erwinia sp. V71 TaxID=3369424 RepID=UPI003F5E78A1
MSHTPLIPTPFILSLQQNSLADFPWLNLTEIRFAPQHYDDALFSLLECPFPAHLQQAVRKRRAEYLASRYAARTALASAGIADFLLLNDHQRAPIWPAGICGSLSHSEQRAVLLTAAARPQRWIGIDTEQLMSRERAAELSEVIITARERQWLQHSDISLALGVTLAFSLKESLYKALYPALRQFMDFHSAEVVMLDQENGRASLKLTRDFRAEFSAGRQFAGYFRQQQDEITTYIVDDSQPAVA